MTAGSLIEIVSRPPSTSRVTSALPSAIFTFDANVACGQPSSAASICPVWFESSSIACLPRMTRSGLSFFATAVSSLATASGCNSASVSIRIARSAPIASAVRSVSWHAMSPHETATISVTSPASLSRTASSTAISSNGFIDILMFAVSTPVWSALTRTLTLKSTTRLTATRAFIEVPRSGRERQIIAPPNVRSPLFELDVERLDDSCVALVVRAHRVVELRGCGWRRLLESEPREPRAQIPLRYSLDDHRVDLRDELRGHLRRGDRADPITELEARVAELCERRHLRQQSRTGAACDRERLQPAGPDQRQRGDQSIEHQRHLAADDILQRRRRALVGDMQQVDPGALVEHESGVVRHGARAIRGIAELAGICLCERDQLLQRVGLESGMRDEDETGTRHLRNGLQVLERIEAHLEHERDLGQNVLRTDKERLPVGRGAHQRVDCNRAAATGLVFDDDRLADAGRYAFRDDAGGSIRGSARRRRNDKPDWLVRPADRRRREQGGSHARQQAKQPLPERAGLHAGSLLILLWKCYRKTRPRRDAAGIRSECMMVHPTCSDGRGPRPSERSTI